MEKITNPCEPEEDKYIFTEGSKHSKTEKTSIWGTGDKDTLELLKKTDIRGKWLNLAAGDGRYNLNLLEKVDFVVASDIDESALSNLQQNTPKEYRSKLKTEAFDINGKFPFENKSFDGVFCTGSLHFFPKEVLRRIFSEIYRILKSNGKIIIDFATDIKRVLPDNKLYVRKSELHYSCDDAEKILKELLKNYHIQIIKSEVPEEEIKTRGDIYKFSCNFILLIAHKE